MNKEYKRKKIYIIFEDADDLELVKNDIVSLINSKIGGEFKTNILEA